MLFRSLDTPRALIALREIEKSTKLTDGEKREIFQSIDPLFGLNLLQANLQLELPAEVTELIAARARAREAKDFTQSDRLRDQLAALGIEIRDTDKGQEWVKKN